MTAQGITEALTAAMRTECRRLTAGSGRERGSTNVQIEVADNGFVSVAFLRPGFRDAKVDSLFGGAAASLKFDRLRKSTTSAFTGTLRMSYSCTLPEPTVTLRML